MPVIDFHFTTDFGALVWTLDLYLGTFCQRSVRDHQLRIELFPGVGEVGCHCVMGMVGPTLPTHSIQTVFALYSDCADTWIVVDMGEQLEVQAGDSRQSLLGSNYNLIIQLEG